MKCSNWQLLTWIKPLRAGILSLLLTAALAQEAEPGETGEAAGAGVPAADSAPARLQFDVEAAGDPLGSFRLSHGERVIAVQQFAPQAEGGQFRTNVPNCEEDLRLSTVYAPSPYAVVTDIGETSIVSPIVLARRPPREEGGEDQQTLEMFGGSLSVDENFCPQELQRSAAPGVFIRQGRTIVSGTELFYDNATGLADLNGPIDLQRTSESGDNDLTATADSLVFDVNTDLSTLKGDVEVISDKRVSHAETLILNEEEAYATLLGSPARSVEGENVLEGDTLLYYLDTDDVIVLGGVSGKLMLDLSDP